MRQTAMGWLLAAAIATSSQVSFAAELPDLISGNRFPLTLKLRDLNNEWRGFSMSGQYEMGDWMQTFSSLFGTSASNLYYTKGQTVSVGNETYLVAYRIESKPEKLTAETSLTLSLLNLRTIGSLNNIRLFNLQQEVLLFDRMTKTRPFNFPVPPSPRTQLPPLVSPPQPNLPAIPPLPPLPSNRLIPAPPPNNQLPALPLLTPSFPQIQKLPRLQPTQEQRSLPRLEPRVQPTPVIEPAVPSKP